RCGTMPSPRSRTDCTAAAVTVSAAPATMPISAGHTAFSSYGRVFYAHPNGDSHAGQALCIRVRAVLGVPSALPRPARTYEVTRIHTASEFAPREVRINWAARSPTPRKHRPTDAGASPEIHDPAAGYPEPRYAVATSTPSTTFAATPCRIVAVKGASRAAGVAEISSARPCSSSARVWRTARR